MDRFDIYSPNALTASQREAANLIVEQAEAARINPEFMLALAVTESSLRPGITGDDGISIGLFQMQLRTAKQFVDIGSAEELHDPVTNTRAAMRFMAWLHDQWPGHTFADYAQAWTFGGAGYFVQGKRNPKKVTNMERAIADLRMTLNLSEVWA